jgi:spermidine synthase
VALLTTTPVVLALLFGSVCAQARPGERVIHHEDGDHYGIWVVERDGTRFLRFARDGVDQSAVRLGDPTWLEFTYTKTLMAAFAVAKSRNRVLVIGLGGGTIPMFLRRVMPGADIEVVEIEPRVAEVAKAHLGFAPDPKLRVHIADGRRFIEESPARWDVIVLDAYGPDSVPPTLATREFLVAVRDHLAPDGIVAANLWAETANRSYRSMLRTYEEVFPEVHVVRALRGASRIVIAPLARQGWDGAAFERAAAALTEAWGLRFELLGIVGAGYEPPGTHPSGGSVLRDP